ncbi:restriction endonuclease subunit S [Flavobacterium sp.]|uniref:restriction endonuclease subunit S n=1 Tax=Flavobacterium sp. TaxID=239 RepID=UPI00261F90AA|nr:restriction endonuclease subunit S [Flavobacterium sp.]MDD3004487.1 restriction endonuclease subunit S [Flavobacterium sp.]
MNTTTQHKTNYKNSPLGLIPEDWEVKKIGKITKTTAGGTPSTHKLEYWNGDIKWMSSGDLNLKKIYDVEGRITAIGLKNSSTKIIPSKCILIGLAGQGKTRGTVAMNMVELCTNQSVAAILPSKEFYEDYLFHNLDYRYYELRQLSTGDGGRGGLNLNIINSIPVPIPPLPEQTAIANCLSTWDKAIAAQTQLIAQKELSKKALMQQLLSGKKRLKGFSDKWHLKSLEEIATFRNGKAHENGIDEDGAYKVVNSKFVSTNGTVFKSSNNNLCPLFVNEIAMVMSDIPNGKALAKCFYVDENNKYTLNQRICSIIANKVTNSKFLFYVLNRNVHYLSFDNGVGQTNLKKEEVLECPLLMPDFEEQTAIANVLQCADDELQLLKKKLEQLKEQKKGLMQVLLTGKKRLRY